MSLTNWLGDKLKDDETEPVREWRPAFVGQVKVKTTEVLKTAVEKKKYKIIYWDEEQCEAQGKVLTLFAHNLKESDSSYIFQIAEEVERNTRVKGREHRDPRMNWSITSVDPIYENFKRIPQLHVKELNEVDSTTETIETEVTKEEHVKPWEVEEDDEIMEIAGKMIDVPAKLHSDEREVKRVIMRED